jgi:hypothetical protein
MVLVPTTRMGPDRPTTPPGPPQPVFCDESGMTGNDLLDANQAFFTYAGVAIGFKRAKGVVEKLVRDHKLQGIELKGKNLVKSGSGRRAVRALIREVRGEAHLVVHHKKYALACKFFEYIFEPVLARQNSIFYEAGFHRFIANLLYFWTEARQESAAQLLTDFAAYMRNLDPTRVPAFFGQQSIVIAAGADPLSHVGTFCVIHRRKIAEELEGLDGTPTGKWILDLTSSSLFSILAHWGDRHHQLDVFCDESKALQANDIFDAMINRSDRAYIRFGEKERLLTFNLARSPQLVRSGQYFGVQIADVLSSALRHALEHRDDAEAQTWLKDLMPSLSDESVWPDPKKLDLQTPEAFANGIVLRELIERSLQRENLFDGIPELISTARADFPDFQRRQGNRVLLV